MRLGSLGFVAAAISLMGCDYTTASFRPYESRSPAIVEGQGGVRETVDGIDIWANGDPPRRYQVIGSIELRGYEGYGSPNEVLARKVREVGGNAAIRMNRSSQFGGGVFASNVFVAYNTTSANYLVVRYILQ
jgi:hypothetical protein